MDEFSDVYRLDRHLRIVEIYKSLPHTRVFAGFSFAQTRLAEYLKPTGEAGAHSRMMRGYEDDTPTIYFAVPLLGTDGGFLLAALELAYIQNFLAHYSAYSGNPVYIVAADGFVMFAAGSPSEVSVFDLKRIVPAPASRHAIALGGQLWIPIVLETEVLGSKIVALVPAEMLASQRKSLLVLLSLLLLWITATVVFRNRHINQFVFKPIVTLGTRMHTLEQGHGVLDREGKECRFEELASIHSSFVRMADAIREREEEILEQSEQLRSANARLEALAITVSIGVVTIRPQAADTVDSVIARADSQLYAAKTGGRNRVVYLDTSGTT